MRQLYPELEPFASDYLQTSEHTIYFEQCGNPQGLPVVFLHGGPGSGCSENHRRYFDPAQYHIILFDQRGCHRSTPKTSNGLLAANTTPALLSDMDAIRGQLNISKWVLFGGSWGATLALLYAQQYPQHTKAVILRGTFLARPTDLDWFLGHGVRQIFPDYWAEFIAHFKGNSQKELLATLYEQLTTASTANQLAAARAWSLYAGRVVTHNIMADYQLDDSDETKLITATQIEVHYAKHGYFINENQILDDIAHLPDVPITIIHGRRDLTCLPAASWAVQQALIQHNKQSATLRIVPEAGHLASETTMVDALITATNEMAELLQ